MSKDHLKLRWLLIGLAVLSIIIYLSACSSPSSSVPSTSVDEMLTLPELEAVELDGEPLRVVATTSIIGDVIAQVGGDEIMLTTLMEPGQDPHSYEPAARELTAVAEADVIFVNGWDLEEGLIDELAQIGAGVPMAAISANIEPLSLGQDENADGNAGEEHHHGADPHTWFSVGNVKQWTENVASVLSELDPANSETYRHSAAAYMAELEELETYSESALAQMGEENRYLVTNHESFGYFADAYGFTVLGTVIPAASTLAEPSASDLAGLIKQMEAHDVCAIITEATTSTDLAQTVAAELDGCDEVKVLQLYTGSIGLPGSGADSYLGMFRANVDVIVEGLQ